MVETRNLFRRLSDSMIKKIKSFINKISGFIFDRRMLDQFIPLQTIKRTQEEYEVIYYGEHEVFEPTQAQNKNLAEFPRLSLAIQPQALPKPYYYQLSSAGIYRMDVIDPNNPNRILLENFPDVSNPFEKRNFPIAPWNKFHIHRRMKNNEYDAEKAFLFAGRWWGNYYHFIIDYCIRFRELEAIGLIDANTKILFPGKIKSWQSEYFSLLGINVDNVILTNKNPLFVRNCLIASTRRERFLVSKSACNNFVQDMIKTTNQAPDISKNKRIYISRKNSSRKILNEYELINLLEEHEFEIVQCENLSVAQQIKLFSQANLIVAPHGAGLTNLIYAEKPRVIEIVPRDEWVWGYFAALTCRLGGDYQAITGSTVNKAMDFTVNISELSSALNR